MRGSPRSWGVAAIIVLLLPLSAFELGLPWRDENSSMSSDAEASTVTLYRPPGTEPGEFLAGFLEDSFVANEGQLTNDEVAFYTGSGPIAWGFGPDRVLLNWVQAPPTPGAVGRGGLIGLRFEGALTPYPLGEEPLGISLAFFLGNDPRS